jgi:hypothetical protein
MSEKAGMTWVCDFSVPYLINDGIYSYSNMRGNDSNVLKGVVSTV